MSNERKTLNEGYKQNTGGQRGYQPKPNGNFGYQAAPTNINPPAPPTSGSNAEKSK